MASALLVAAILCAPRLAAATPVRHVVMEWSRDEPACLDGAVLAAMVERTLGRPVFYWTPLPSPR